MLPLAAASSRHAVCFVVLPAPFPVRCSWGAATGAPAGCDPCFPESRHRLLPCLRCPPQCAAVHAARHHHAPLPPPARRARRLPCRSRSVRVGGGATPAAALRLRLLRTALHEWPQVPLLTPCTPPPLPSPCPASRLQPCWRFTRAQPCTLPSTSRSRDGPPWLSR